MGLIESHFAFTRLFLFLGGAVMVVFLSSPAVMLAKLQNIDPTDILKFNWTKDMGWFGYYVHKSLPPLTIILINTGIISLLNLASVIEAYGSHS